MKRIISFFTEPIVQLILGSFVLRLTLASFGTLTLDQNTFIAWAHSVNERGAALFYSGWSDYLPGYIYVLWALAKLEYLLPHATTLLYKLPAIFGDLVAGGLIYFIVREKKGKRFALIASALLLLNPALLSNSTLWGQVDIFTGLFALLAVYLFEKNWLLSATALALGSLIKPQAALAAPVILFLMYTQKENISNIFKYVLVSGAIFLLGFYPFASGNLLSFVTERMSATLSQYPYSSINAFNFWGMWGFWKNEGVGIFSFKNIGILIFIVSSLISLKKFWKVRNHKYGLLSVLLLSNFLFFTRMHERHMLPSLIPLSVFVAMEPILVVPFIALSIMYVLNMNYAYIWISENYKEIYSQSLVIIFSLINIFSLIYIVSFEKIKTIYSSLFLFFTSKKVVNQSFVYVKTFWNQKKEPLLKPSFYLKKEKAALSCILLFALVTRLWGLGSPSQEYFDEVYHAFTAKAILNHDIRAWEWWNENPPGYAYEWTHPPFAKEAMVVGMLVFGENSFGYRIPAALLGVGGCFLIYLISKKLFNKEVALLSAFVFSLDGLPLVLSRIGMNDMYLVFFVLLSLYVLLKEKYFLSSLFFGFALASKWTTFWFFPIFFALHLLKHRKVTKESLALWVPPLLFFRAVATLDHPEAYLVFIVYCVSVSGVILYRLFLKKPISYLYFLLIPFLVYIGSYIPQFTSGHNWEIFWGMQRQMWWYHTGLVASHPYTSPWWSWPLLIRPIWLYTSGPQNGSVANIYVFGNPFIFWGGFLSVVLSLYYAFREKRKNLLFVTAGYFGVFVPWALSPRIMFLYHYFPAIPFLSICLGFVLSKHKKYVLPFLVFSTVFFLYFYPHWSGISVPEYVDQSYYWLPSWR